MLTEPRWQLQFRSSGLSLCRPSGVVGFGIWVFFFNAAFNFILTRIRGEFFFFSRKLREAVLLVAPMWLENIIGRSLCGAVLVTLRAREAMTTNCPPPPSQGQGWWVCQGSCSLDLFCCASPFLCQEGSLPLQIHTVISTRKDGGELSLPFYSILFLDATTPKSLFLCGLAH